LQERRQSPGERCRIVQLAFPDDQYAPACPAKSGQGSAITLSVLGSLGLPKRGVRYGRAPTSLAGVHVPETTVDEKDSSARWHHDVGLARQISAV